MRSHLAVILFACSLSSCATIFAGSYADVYLEGYDGPLTVTDTAGNAHHVVQGRSGGKPYALIELDKREDQHTLIVSNGIESSTHHLHREINWYWLIPNYSTWELGFLVDLATTAAFDFPDVWVSFQSRAIDDTVFAAISPTPRNSIRRTAKGVMSLAAGFSLPVHFAPQGPSLVAANFGVKIDPTLAVGVDLSFTGISQQERVGQTIVKTLFNVGPSLTYTFRDEVLLSIAPTFQHVQFSMSGQEATGGSLGSRNFYTVGIGLGFKSSGGFLLEGRLFPSFYSRPLSNGVFVNAGHMQLRIGYAGEAALFQ